MLTGRRLMPERGGLSEQVCLGCPWGESLRVAQPRGQLETPLLGQLLFSTVPADDVVVVGALGLSHLQNLLQLCLLRFIRLLGEAGTACHARALFRLLYQSLTLQSEE